MEPEKTNYTCNVLEPGKGNHLTSSFETQAAVSVMVNEQKVVNVIGNNMNITGSNMDVSRNNLDMTGNSITVTTEHELMNVVESLVSENVELSGQQIIVNELEEYLEVLQECPVCHKMFMRSDYENYHINTHKSDEQNVAGANVFVEVMAENIYETKEDLNANDVWNGFQDNAAVPNESPEHANKPLVDGQGCSSDINRRFNISVNSSTSQIADALKANTFKTQKELNSSDNSQVPVRTSKSCEEINKTTSNTEKAVNKLCEFLSINQSLEGIKDSGYETHKTLDFSTVVSKTTQTLEDTEEERETDDGESLGFSDSLSINKDQALNNLQDNKTDVNVCINSTENTLNADEIDHKDASQSETVVTKETKQETQIKFQTSLNFGTHLCSRCPEIFVEELDLINHFKTDHPEEEEKVFNFHEAEVGNENDLVINIDDEETDVIIEGKEKAEISESCVTDVGSEVAGSKTDLSHKNKMAWTHVNKTSSNHIDEVDSDHVNRTGVIPLKKASLNHQNLDVRKDSSAKHKELSSGSRMAKTAYMTELNRDRKQKKMATKSKSPAVHKTKVDKSEKKSMIDLARCEPIRSKLVIQRKLVMMSKALHECPVCFRQIYLKHRLESHIKSHSEDAGNCAGQESIRKLTVQKNLAGMKKDLHECPICLRQISGQTQFQEHLKIHKNPKKNLFMPETKAGAQEKLVSSEQDLHKCPVCFCMIAGKYPLKVHMKTHAVEIKTEDQSDDDDKIEIQKKRASIVGGELQECPLCCRLIYGKVRLEAHMKSHSPTKQTHSKTQSSTTGNFEERNKQFTQNKIASPHSPNNELLQCPECSKKVHGQHRLTSHMRTHNSELKTDFEEEMETQEHDSKDVLQSQKKDSNEKEFVKCSVCQKMQRRKYMQTHMQIVHSPLRPFECEVCSATFPRKYALMRHAERHAKRNFKCDRCNKAYVTLADLKRHTRLHSYKRDFPCQECGLAFTCSGELTKHLKSHSVVQKYSCDRCGKSWPHKFRLQKHMQTEACKRGKVEMAFKHTCTKCGKMFAKRFQLDQHVQLHNTKSRADEKVLANTDQSGQQLSRSKAREYKETCEVCEKKFRDKYGLERHLRTHSILPGTPRTLSSRKTSCRICGKVFNFKISLIQHLKCHSEVREYSCRRCGKYFPTRDVLDKHEKSHSSIDFSCSKCEKTFFQAKSLRQHQCKIVEGEMVA